MIIVTALAVSAVIIQFSTATFLPLMLFYYLIIATYVLSIFYLLLYYWGRYQTFQVCLQIFFDLLLITAFVYVSGGLKGSFYFLYIFGIIAASIVLSKRAAYLTAALSGVFFGILVNGMHLGYVPYLGSDQPTELSPGTVINNIFISWSMFFIVAFLVNYMKERLRRTAEKLHFAERELEIKKRLALAGEFSAHLAHEIRNPLAAISGSVQVLRDGLELTGKQKELMENIVEQSSRVSHSIEQFLSLVSPDKKTFSDVNLASVLDETLLLLEDSGELDSHFRVMGNYKGSQISYFGNTNQFKQMFWNLIRNAIKASPEGGAITIDINQDQMNEVQVKIKDSGNGLKDEDREKLVEPVLSSRFQSGSGIGMAVVRRIVDDYNGKIHVFPVRNKGTEVVVVLPKLPAESDKRMRL
ncbi:MAG: HAMP domain-containing histidine kinase [Candidatus Aminicenantes bacterium]|nr:MAG: HAMP domain-containing histidine kinase [Candidatus Aminicenantes bacterium]